MHVLRGGHGNGAGVTVLVTHRTIFIPSIFLSTCAVEVNTTGDRGGEEDPQR